MAFQGKSRVLRANNARSHRAWITMARCSILFRRTLIKNDIFYVSEFFYTSHNFRKFRFHFHKVETIIPDLVNMKI